MSTSSDPDHIWMSRCFELARRGIGNVSPNPPVGAVLVYDNTIIGEGYHAHFGGPHAEVEAFRSVASSQRDLIQRSTLYVSLEPCCITGKTPPCTDLILRESVKDVRVAIKDPNPDVAGQGIQQLRNNGIIVTLGILEDEARELIRSFSTNILHHRPYVILKWAQSQYGYIGKPDEKIWLSHPYTSVWTHKTRSTVDAILVGSRTVMHDDPLLTTRDFPGRSPHRVIYDPNGQLNSTFRVFNDDQCRVFYFSKKVNPFVPGDHIIQSVFHDNNSYIDQILSTLFAQQIGILLVEGGAYVHHLFIDQNNWDEALVIQSSHSLAEGIPAPNVKGRLLDKLKSGTDTVVRILNEDHHKTKT